jgi:tRNA A-37 threonylcarbamoyl transferase component Bud32
VSPRGDESDPEEFATNVFMWDCKLVGVNENVKLLSSNKDPSVLIKMQRDPTKKHVAEEMENEASVYKILSRNTEVREAVPSFRAFSNHLGVVVLCTGREGLDFEDIGVDNLSQELKFSAVNCLQLLGRSGVLHNDLVLRNIVQSAENASKAKIIDFGLAAFSKDRDRLQEQVEALKSKLGIASGDTSKS